jgi:Rieske Fe-S protein
MSTVSTLAASSSMYRSYPASGQGSAGSSATSLPTRGTATEVEPNAFSPAPDSTTTTGPDESADATTVTDSQASADYRALAKDMQSDNVTALQRDTEKLQTDLAVTRSEGSRHYHFGGRLPAIVPSTGSNVNVTV